MFNTNLGNLSILGEFLFFQINVDEPSHFPDSNEYKGKNNSRASGGKWEQSWQRRAGNIRR